ncbi:LacI family DNA-binding transcriptional regulator [Roseicyclus sp. F158]|uniref:LacI family DNA-binding transcriptional regulator n=1 Tax=Tropicimonas omnivorans TaxID=3075590 RepID=A0ABU3DHN1_9RHOB|nr:LacI family DNA-binding transcriptional regulator [Roseicyclus sp. F158]MDT0683230.1 LacI family DNA-binding transcriptional regulator [Roseicyclus sp. F158]
MQPKLKDIANALGVSPASVSNALRGTGRVSAELAERVRAEADRLGYRPGPAGRALRTGRSQMLGLILPDLSNPLFPRMAQAIQRQSETAGYGILIADSHGDRGGQEEAIARMLQRGVDALVIIPRRGTVIETLPVPHALIDTPSTPGNTVSADHRGGGATIVRHLAERGHSSLVLIGDSDASPVQRDRIAGMRESLGEGMTATTAWLEEDGISTCLEAIGRGATAIATTSDLVALQILGPLNEAGIEVPEQVALSGFDDLVFASVMRPALTTLVADSNAIGSHAIETLTAILEGRPSPPPMRVPMTLIPRASTALKTNPRQETIPC